MKGEGKIEGEEEKVKEEGARGLDHYGHPRKIARGEEEKVKEEESEEEERGRGK